MAELKQLDEMDEVELKATMLGAADMVKAALPRGTLFTILAFRERGIAQYIANANRQDMIRMLRETADRLERREDVER